ncbi:MAG: DUF6048 family protein, partial [Bacteroidota bacterium]
MQHILKYIIRSVLLLSCVFIKAQDQTINLNTQDTTTQVHRYGMRVGADISRHVRSAFESDYEGFELVGDYRISKKFYVAAELGTEERTTNEDQYSFTTSGNYVKIGFDYNAYENWYGMENLIYAGLRYGFGTFSQTLNYYVIYNADPYWSEGDIPGTNPDLLVEYSGLTGHWVEVVVGLKA